MSEELSVTVQRLLESTLLRYSHQQLDSRQRSELLDDYTRVASNLGIKRFEEALIAARLRCKFVPQPADILENAPMPDPIILPKHPQGCTLCAGLGWIMVPSDVPGKQPRAKKCGGVTLKLPTQES